MNLNLNPEQIAYLKGLDSKEKRREFILDCLVENVIGKSEKNEDNNCEICGRYTKIKDSNKCKSCNACVKHSIETNPFFTKPKEEDGCIKVSGLPRYISPQEYDTVPKELMPKENEFLKFDMLEESYSIPEKDNFMAWVYNRLLLKYKENPLFDYMHKLREIAKTYNPEKKYTEKDMRKCFNEARYLKMEWKSGSVITVSKFTNFDDYLKIIEK